MARLDLYDLYRQDRVIHAPDPCARLVIGSTEYRYKPGWQMGYNLDRSVGFGQLQLTWMAPDAYHPERSQRIASMSIIDHRLPVTQQIYEAIKAAEIHELNEFFVVDGQRPFDPHRRAL